MTLKDKIRAEKAERELRNLKFEQLWQKAVEAGNKAAIEGKPPRMGVRDLNGKLVGVVDDGACGFAWIKVRPGNCRFANWGKKTGLFKKDWNGGVMHWVSAFGQSVDRKAAFAGGVQRVLREGLAELDPKAKVWGQSRLD